MASSEGQLVEEDDEELWAEPERPSPFIAFLNDLSRPHFSNDVHAWNELNPSEQAPYIAQTAALTQKYEAEVRAFNARIPLSPLIRAPNSNRYCEQRHLYERFRKRVAQLWNRYRRDHPLACGGASSPIPSRSFRFLDLPRELRAMILRAHLHRASPLTQMEANGTAIDYDTATNDGPVDVRVFAASKQTYVEATDAFFAANCILIDLGENLLPPLFRTAGNARSATLLAKVKRIQLCIPLYRVPEAARLGWLLRHLCEIVAARCLLTELLVVPVSPASWYSLGMHEVMERVLEEGGLLSTTGLMSGGAAKRVRFMWEEEDALPYGGEASLFLRDKVVLTTEGLRRRVKEAR
ncbi:MAG: hypothetical protein Q9173_006899 [Seirophora scorigena]